MVQRTPGKKDAIRFLAALCLLSGTAQAEVGRGPPTHMPADEEISSTKIERFGHGNSKTAELTRGHIDSLGSGIPQDDAPARRSFDLAAFEGERIAQKISRWRIHRPEERTREMYSHSLILAQASWSRPPTPQMVAEAQSLLGRLGFDAGPADGAMGFRTRQAIRNYQSQAGLPVNGQVSEDLLTHLRRSHAQGRVVRFGVSTPSDQDSQSGQTDEPSGVRSVKSQEIVDELRKIIDWASSRQMADPELLDRLRALARRYDLLWPVRVFHDEFADGNYTENPRWTAQGGDISVTSDDGLRLSLKHPKEPAASTERGKGDPAAEILGSILQQVLKEKARPQQQQARSDPATIRAAAKITNAFSAEFRLRGYTGSAAGHIEIGIYPGTDHWTGYRLDYKSGKKAGIELRRESAGRSSVIDFSMPVPSLDDGKWHTVEWQRKKNGEMTVSIDGKRVVSTVDRAYRQGFGGIAIVNHKGEHAIRSVSVHGTKG